MNSEKAVYVGTQPFLNCSVSPKYSICQAKLLHKINENQVQYINVIKIKYSWMNKIAIMCYHRRKIRFNNKSKLCFYIMSKLSWEVLK